MNVERLNLRVLANERIDFEQQLAEAQTSQWPDCPKRLRTKVTPLARFIASPELQKAITATPVEQLNLPDNSAEATDDEIASFKIETEPILEVMEAAEVAQPEKKLAYHNAEHARQVIVRVEQLMQIARPRVTKDQARALLVAAVFHDIEHHGTATQQPHNYSVEQNAANVADKYAQTHSFTLRQRIEMYTATISTSFWDKKIQPATQAEKIFQLADYGGYMESLNEWIDQSLNMATENSMAQPPTDLVASWLDEPDFEQAIKIWLAGQAIFIKEVIRPAHNNFRQQFLDPTEPWPAEAALREKETAIYELQTNITDPSYTLIVTKIRTKLTALRERYRKTILA